LGKEYYRLYVEFFGPINDSFEYIKIIDNGYNQGHIGVDEISLICHRIAKTYQEYTELAWEINFWGSQFFARHEISNYKEAKLCIDHCEEINQIHKNLNPNQIRNDRTLAQALIIEVETNNISQMENRFEEIENRTHLKANLPNEEYKQLLFNKVKICFILFKGNYPEKGNQILEELEKICTDQHDLTRIEFYRLKLIKSTKTMISNKLEFDSNIFKDYEARFQKLIAPVSEQLSQFSPEWSIRKEIMNDYFGAFLNDRLFANLIEGKSNASFTFDLLSNPKVTDFLSSIFPRSGAYSVLLS
jgi:hypothetical protein